jgi:hypothetical protein
MSNFNIKSLILGIGIGIVLTSVLGAIYSAGVATTVSREFIISEAKKYGMVESTDTIRNMNNLQNTQNASDHTLKP